MKLEKNWVPRMLSEPHAVTNSITLYDQIWNVRKLSKNFLELKI